jgi:hypothetical protein
MSVLDLLAELEGVGKPDGDPGLVRQAAEKLAGLAVALEHATATVEHGVAQALAGWEGRASQQFATKAAELVRPVRQAAGVLRAAAGVANVYASRLEVAQARWRQARGGAIVGRGLKLPELLDPDFRRAVAAAEAADAEARAAAVAFAAELRRLADRPRRCPLESGHRSTRTPGWAGGCSTGPTAFRTTRWARSGRRTGSSTPACGTRSRAGGVRAATGQGQQPCLRAG